MPLFCVLIILFEDIIIEQYFENKSWKMNILEIIQKCYECKLWDKLFYFLVYQFYKAHDG